MDFRHLIVTCLFSMFRLPFDNQKVKENYAILQQKLAIFLKKNKVFFLFDLLFFGGAGFHICTCRRYLLCII